MKGDREKCIECGRVRLRHEARRHRPAALADAGLALPLTPMETAAEEHASAEELEQLEIELLLEAIYRRYGFDFREYAQASLKRRLWRRVAAERLSSISRAAGTRAARPGLHGAAAARPLDQRHVDVPRPDLLRRVPRARRADPAHATRSRASGSRAARPARRSTRSRSCSRRRASTTARGSTRPTSTRPCSSARGSGVFPLDKMQEYTQNYIRAGGTRAFSEYYTSAYDGAPLRPRARAERRLRAAQPRLRPVVQRVPRDRLPERDDLLRPPAAGPGARALPREPRRRTACSRSAARRRSGFTLHADAYDELDPDERLYRKVR